MLSTPRPAAALWYWGGPILVTLLAAVLRFWNLGHPQALVFDETYYVKDAWTLLHNGYESAWPEGADERLRRRRHGHLPTSPPYVVHPPLGKWMISLGMAAFGAERRVLVARDHGARGHARGRSLLTLVARRLLASTLVAVIAGAPARRSTATRS